MPVPSIKVPDITGSRLGTGRFSWSKILLCLPYMHWGKELLNALFSRMKDVKKKLVKVVVFE
jgi:hypothetical protein